MSCAASVVDLLGLWLQLQGSYSLPCVKLTSQAVWLKVQAFAMHNSLPWQWKMYCNRSKLCIYPSGFDRFDRLRIERAQAREVCFQPRYISSA